MYLAIMKVLSILGSLIFIALLASIANYLNRKK